jgi:tetratricopeptide (TPR) repeat protein
LLKQYEGYDYAEILTRWARVFGEDAIVPRLFERGPDRKFDVLEDFASVCGFTVPDTSRARSKDANPAISLAAQHALLLLGAKLQDLLGSQRVNGNAWHRICYNVTGVAAGQGWQPTREEARGLVAHFAASNEAVRARWFKDRPSLFNDDFDFLPEQPVQPDPGQVLDVMAAAFASATQNGIRREQELRVEKALLMDEMGEPDKAMDLLATALRHDGRDVSARLNLAKLQIQSGAFRKARVNVDAALELEPNNKMGQRLLQRLLKRTNEETEV